MRVGCDWRALEGPLFSETSWSAGLSLMGESGTHMPTAPSVQCSPWNLLEIVASPHFSWAVDLLFLFQKSEPANVVFTDLEVICFADTLKDERITNNFFNSGFFRFWAIKSTPLQFKLPSKLKHPAFFLKSWDLGPGLQIQRTHTQLPSMPWWATRRTLLTCRAWHRLLEQ